MDGSGIWAWMLPFFNRESTSSSTDRKTGSVQAACQWRLQFVTAALVPKPACQREKGSEVKGRIPEDLWFGHGDG